MTADTPETYSGVVVMEAVSPGSKSSRMAVQLDTGDEMLMLRRPGTKSYRDETLQQLVGKQVSCVGLKRGSRLYLREWRIVDAE